MAKIKGVSRRRASWKLASALDRFRQPVNGERNDLRPAYLEPRYPFCNKVDGKSETVVLRQRHGARNSARFARLDRRG